MPIRRTNNLVLIGERVFNNKDISFEALGLLVALNGMKDGDDVDIWTAAWGRRMGGDTDIGVAFAELVEKGLIKKDENGDLVLNPIDAT